MQLSRPSKILFAIARGDAFGGSSLHIMDMASRLESEGHTVRIIVGGNPDMEVPRRFSERNLTFICVPELGRQISLFKDLKSAWAIRREARHFQPDLISLHSSKAGAVGRIGLIGTSIPQLYTPHCWAFVDGFPKARFYRLMEKLLAPLSTQIVAVSEDERSFALKSGVGNEKQIITIHNGVVDTVSDDSNEQSEPASPTRIIMVGRFEEQKNHAMLLRSLARLKNQNWKLTLVGEGPLRESCRSLACDLGIAERVDFAGYSNKVIELLKKHDLFALISKWEGFPRSILEAMSMSLPVIASDVGGCREAVVDGENGRVVSPDNEDELTEALEDLLSDPDRLRQMGRDSRRSFERHFNFDVMYAGYLRLYNSLIAKHSSEACSPSNMEGNSAPCS